MSGLLSTDRELKNHLETECASAPASTVLVGSVHRMDSAHTRVAWEELCPPKWALHKGHFRLCRLSVKLSRWEGGRLSMSFFFCCGERRAEGSISKDISMQLEVKQRE